MNLRRRFAGRSSHRQAMVGPITFEGSSGKTGTTPLVFTRSAVGDRYAFGGPTADDAHQGVAMADGSSGYWRSGRSRCRYNSSQGWSAA